MLYDKKTILIIVLAPRLHPLESRELGRVLSQFLADAADQIPRVLALVRRGTLKAANVRQRAIDMQQMGKVSHALKRRVVSLPG